MVAYHYSFLHNSNMDGALIRLAGAGPITAIMEQVQGENVPERLILIELRTRLLAVDDILNQAISTVPDDGLYSLYSQLQAKMADFYNQVLSVVQDASQQGIYQAHTVNLLLMKLADVDPAKYKKVLDQLNYLMGSASEIDGAINYLVPEIRKRKGSGSVLPAPVPLPKLTLPPPPSIEKVEEQDVQQQEVVQFPPAFKMWFDNLSRMPDDQYAEYKNYLLNKFYGVTQEGQSRLSLSLDRLKNLGRTGSVYKSRLRPGESPTNIRSESTGHTNRYDYLNKDLLPYQKELETSSFEDVLLKNPQLLVQISDAQAKLEGQWSGKGTVKTTADKAKEFYDNIGEVVYSGKGQSPIGQQVYSKFKDLSKAYFNDNGYTVSLKEEYMTIRSRDDKGIDVRQYEIGPDSTFNDLLEASERLHRIMSFKERTPTEKPETDLAGDAEEGTSHVFDAAGKFVLPPEIESILPPEIKKFFEVKGVDEDVLDAMSNIFMAANASVLESQVVPIVMGNPSSIRTKPDSVKGQKIFPLFTPEQKNAFLINNAAINYSIYMLHATHAQVTSVLQKMDSRRQELRTQRRDELEISGVVEKSKENIAKVMTACFPEKLVLKARQSILPDDQKLFNNRTLEKPSFVIPSGKKCLLNDERNGPRLSPTTGKPIPQPTPFLFKEFSKGPNWYGDLINNISMTVIKNFKNPREKLERKEKVSYFSFGGRGTIGLLMAYAYGGGYNVRTGKSISADYESVKSVYPDYGNKPIVMTSLPDFNNTEYFGTGEDEVETYKEITQKVGKLIRPVDDISTFAMAYMGVSVDDTINRRMGKLTSLPDLMQSLRDRYIAAKMPKTASLAYKYLFPLKFLFA